MQLLFHLRGWGKCNDRQRTLVVASCRKYVRTRNTGRWNFHAPCMPQLHATSEMACGNGTHMRFQPPLATPVVKPIVRSLALAAHQRFPKTSKFTDSFVVHGRWENNTLDAATDLRQRELRLKERTT